MSAEMVGADSLVLAMWACITFVLRVRCEGVCLEIPLAARGVVAQAALVRPNPGVIPSNVTDQVSLLHTRIATHRALERTDVAVFRKVVRLEIGFVGTAVAAAWLWAFERSFSSVPGPAVAVQRRLLECEMLILGGVTGAGGAGSQ